MHPSHRNAPLRRFFSGVAEWTFQSRIGLADPPLIDYLSEMLVRFIRYDAIFKLRNLAGQRLEQVAEMLMEAEQRVGSARREAHRHIGDFTLFWTGLYPESLRRLQSASRIDHFVDYTRQGKRSYHLASAYSEGDLAEEGAVLQRLSEQFELCAYGLREVRREWETSDEPPQTPLLLD